jgi:hypothetical protein
MQLATPLFHPSDVSALLEDITLPDGAIMLKREVKLSALPDVRTATAEEYWPDIEGLDHRDTVTDFGLPEGTFFDCALVHLLTTATLNRLWGCIRTVGSRSDGFVR